MTKTYTTVQGDMWDSIAYKLYGSESGLNALLEANPAYMDYVVLPGGLTLKVPEYTKPTTNRLPPWRR